MTQKGFVVDYLNNNHTDCRISNLEFLKKAYNTAKGQAFDVDSKMMKRHIAVNIFKDFSTGCYQITIDCNDNIVGETTDGKIHYVSAIMLLYDCDYSIVVNDAENILRVYETEGRIYTKNTYACDVKVKKAIYIQLSEEEKNRSFVIRDGKPFLILGTGNAFLNSVHFEKGWQPPEKK